MTRLKTSSVFMVTENSGIPFGVRLRCGNFYVQKFSRGLSRSEHSSLRKECSIPKGERLPLVRGTLPFIRLASISGSWRLEWACTMHMFSLLNSLEVVDGVLSESALSELKSLLSVLYTETTVLGDADLMKDRVNSIASYISRITAPRSDKDDELLDDERLRQRTIDNLKEIGDDEQ